MLFSAILYGIDQFSSGCIILGNSVSPGTDVMNQSLIYFLSVVIGAILSYLINQLPGVPETVKSWLWFPVIGLMLLSVWVGLRLMSDSRGSKRSQDVLTNLEGQKIQVKSVTVESTSGEPVDQKLLSGLKATENIDVGDVSAKQ